MAILVWIGIAALLLVAFVVVRAVARKRAVREHAKRAALAHRRDRYRRWAYLSPEAGRDPSAWR